MRECDAILRCVPDGVTTAPSILQRVVRGATVTAVAQIYGMALSVATSAILVRILGGPGFGAFNYMQGLALLLTAFAGSGLSLTTVRFLPDYRTRDAERAGQLLSAGFTFAVILGVVLGAGLSFWPIGKELESGGVSRTGRLLTAAILLPNAICSMQLGALMGLEAFRKSAISNAARATVQLPLTIGLSIAWGIEGALLGALLTVVFQCVINELQIRRCCAAFRIQYSYLTRRPDFRHVGSFSVPSFLASLVNAPAQQISNDFLLGQPGGLGQIALMSVAHQWRNAFLFLPGVIGQTALPILSDATVTDKDRNRMLGLIGGGSFVLLLCLAAGSYALGPVFDALYGDALRGSSMLVCAMGVATAFYAATVPLGQFFLLRNRVWISVFVNGVQMAFLIGFSKLLIGSVSPAALGAAFAYAAAYSSQLAVMVVLFFLMAGRGGSTESKTDVAV